MKINLYRAFVCSICIHLVIFFLAFGVTRGRTPERNPIIIDFSMGERPEAGEPAQPFSRPSAKSETSEVHRPMPTKIAEQQAAPAKEVGLQPAPRIQQVTGTGNQAAVAIPTPTPTPIPDFAPDSGVKAPGYGDGNRSAGSTPLPGQAAGMEKPETRYVKAHFAAIRGSIISRLSYPRFARRRGWTGTVKVSFLVKEDGGVSNVKVLESSGFELLDNNAVETINRCSPYPKPPCRAEMIMPITYRLDE